MNEGKIAVRYAKAMFELAVESTTLDSVKHDVVNIAETCNLAEVKLLLETPVLSANQKKEALLACFGQISELTQRFVAMVVDNKRESHLPGISRNFLARYYKSKGIESATVTTSSELSADQRNQLIETINTVFKTNVELNTQVDEELIGGFVLRVGDQQLDASLQSKLEKVKRELLDTTI
jgi:F-type H+-transporting ATPase subunit delta